MAPKTINPDEGSRAKVKGTKIATAIVAESPGKAPIMIPASTPENAKPKLRRLNDDKKSANIFVIQKLGYLIKPSSLAIALLAFCCCFINFLTSL